MSKPMPKNQTSEDEELDKYGNPKTKKTVSTPVIEPIDNYVKDTVLDKSYRAQQVQLDKAKREAQQSADVSYALLKKYLPVQNQMNGLSGLGVSESALIDANNNYVTQLGKIEQTHAADSAALLENYRTEQSAAADTAYNEAYAMITNGTYHTFEELDNYLAGVKDKVSDEQWAQLEYLSNYAKNDPTAQEMVEEYKNASIPDHSVRTGVYFNRDKNGGGIDNGEVVRVKSGNTEYKVKVKTEAGEAAVVEAGKKYGKNTAFIYNGELYLNIGGITYTLNKNKEYDEAYDATRKKQK